MSRHAFAKSSQRTNRMRQTRTWRQLQRTRASWSAMALALFLAASIFMVARCRLRAFASATCAHFNPTRDMSAERRWPNGFIPQVEIRITVKHAWQETQARLLDGPRVERPQRRLRLLYLSSRHGLMHPARQMTQVSHSPMPPNRSGRARVLRSSHGSSSAPCVRAPHLLCLRSSARNQSGASSSLNTRLLYDASMSCGAGPHERS